MSALATKVCTRCQRDLPLDVFAPNKKGKHGRHSRCRKCQAHPVVKGRFGRIPMDLAARFWTKVLVGGPDDCWEWQAKKSRGYGMLWCNERKEAVRAHRLSLEMALGRSIRDGLFVLHSCDNRACVNPAHLREGTCADNVHDMMERNLAWRHNVASAARENVRRRVERANDKA